jgi:hypothetical protein
MDFAYIIGGIIETEVLLQKNGFSFPLNRELQNLIAQSTVSFTGSFVHVLQLL